MRRTTFRAALVLAAITFLPIASRAASYVAALFNITGYSGESATYAASGPSRVGSAHRGTDIHALLWDSTNSVAVDLNPDQSGSEAYGVWGSSQVGTFFNETTHGAHAALWTGTAESIVDLHPSGARSSIAYNAWGTSQVGYANLPTPGFPDHAMLWNGTAASAIDLNPPGAVTSVARDINAANQVGYARVLSNSGEHAILWSGTAASAIDLNPPGSLRSRALGISGANQAGWAYSAQANQSHAILWSGTAASAVDLQPAGLDYSFAFDASNAGQVGYGGTSTMAGATEHALVWNSTAASATDLHPLLSGLGPTFATSRAYGITDDGVIVGIATDIDAHMYAVMWTPVPEPTSCALIAGGVIVASFWRSRHRRLA